MNMEWDSGEGFLSVLLPGQTLYHIMRMLREVKRKGDLPVLLLILQQ